MPSDEMSRFIWILFVFNIALAAKVAVRCKTHAEFSSNCIGALVSDYLNIYNGHSTYSGQSVKSLCVNLKFVLVGTREQQRLPDGNAENIFANFLLGIWRI